MRGITRRTTLRTLLAPFSMAARTTYRASSAVVSLLWASRRARPSPPQGPIASEMVEKAIRRGVAYLISQQQADGSWPNPHRHHQHTAGPTALAAHALMVAGEKPDSPAVLRALEYLEPLTPEEIDGNYAVGLQTIVYCEADRERFATRILANVEWAEHAQNKIDDQSIGMPGSWCHTSDKVSRRGDNSSSQFALLGLEAAAAAGFPVKPEVWARARGFLDEGQNREGSWPYCPNSGNRTGTASMTCAGISGLAITGRRVDEEDRERLEGDTIVGCGQRRLDPRITRGLDWLARGFSVRQNRGNYLPRLWQFYYLYGLERICRFLGLRWIGDHDWYREGAEEILGQQDPLSGSWTGVAIEQEPWIATSLALLFLATGRAPVLVHKLVHGPGEDWANDPDDVRNLVGAVSEDWGHTLSWQVADPATAPLETLLAAPIAFLNGHEAPEFSPEAKKNLRAFVDGGGVLVADACCGDPRFDQGFRALLQEIFPEPGLELRALDDDHPVYRARHPVDPAGHPLWGIDQGCRTAVIYSPTDLSCGWNQMAAHPEHPSVVRARKLGQNIADYVTGREPPADKLATRKAARFEPDAPRRGALRIAKLRHGGDWNVARLAVPNLANALRDQLGLDVIIDHKELVADDPGLAFYPLLYMHGRAAFTLSDDELKALRQHLEPGGGTLFADAACGSAAFDSSFRAMAARLFPKSPLEPIPTDDSLYSPSLGYNLSDVELSAAAGGTRGYPRLEGLRVDGHWGVIYSKLDLGCTLQRHAGLGCLAYRHDSALRIAANVVLYAMMP